MTKKKTGDINTASKESMLEKWSEKREEEREKEREEEAYDERDRQWKAGRLSIMLRVLRPWLFLMTVSLMCGINKTASCEPWSPLTLMQICAGIQPLMLPSKYLNVHVIVRRGRAAQI